MTNPKLADELTALAKSKAWLEAQIADYTDLGIPDAVSHIRVILAALTPPETTP